MRPDFIPKEIFRKHMKGLHLANHFMVFIPEDNPLSNHKASSLRKSKVITPHGFILKMEREGRPVSFIEVASESHLSKTGKTKLYRPVDIWAKAKAEACKIVPAEETALKIDTRTLRRDIRALKEEKEKLRSQKREEEKLYTSMRDQMEEIKTIQKMSKIFSGFTLYSEEEIVEEAAPAFQVSGVYFLIKDKSIVYVGQSTNVFSRIFAHLGRDWDSYAFVQCAKESLDSLESLYIHLFKPILNGRRGEYMCAPMSMSDLMIRISPKPIPSKEDQCHQDLRHV